MEWPLGPLKHIRPRLDVKTSVLALDRDILKAPFRALM